MVGQTLDGSHSSFLLASLVNSCNSSLCFFVRSWVIVMFSTDLSFCKHATGMLSCSNIILFSDTGPKFNCTMAVDKGSNRLQFIFENICTISANCTKCGIRSTLCWKIGNISGPT